MNSYAVFLRGINVGGINIKMADLKEALKSRPFSAVKTLLASGNVVLASDLPAGRGQSRVRGLPAGDLRLRRLGGGADRGPGGRTGRRLPLPRGRRLHPQLRHPRPRIPECRHELYDAGTALDGVELTRLGPEALAWLAPAGGTLDSPFSKLSAKPKYKAATTTRNLRTMIKVREAAADAGPGARTSPA